MSQLSDAELAAIQADIANLLPDSCNVLTVTRTSDGAGGWSEAWGTALAGIACRLDALSGREQLAGQAVKSFNTFRLTLPYSTVITAAQRIEISSTQYNVISVDRGKSWLASVRCLVEKV